MELTRTTAIGNSLTKSHILSGVVMHTKTAILLEHFFIWFE